jgi:histidine kinase (EC 2.7.3.-)
VGFGLGLAVGWIRWLSSRKKQPQISSPSNQKSVQPDCSPSDLELAYKMATEMSQFKGGYLARISHELRSPLNGLIGMHQLILSDLCDSPEEEREFITQANVSARKMVEVLDRILDVARVQHGTVRLEIQAVPLAQVFRRFTTSPTSRPKTATLDYKSSLPIQKFMYRLIFRDFGKFWFT